MAEPGTSLLFLIIVCILWPHPPSHLHSHAESDSDTLKQGQELRDYDKLVSTSGAFVLEFFSFHSSAHFIGIRLISTEPSESVWVANAKNPVPDSSGVLKVDNDGILKISYRGGQPIAISSNLGKRTSESNLTVTLLDSGNLVMRQVDSNGVTGPVLWQSFDYPTSTLLPEMKLGFNLKTRHEWYLSSWLNKEVPSTGAFKLGLNPNGSNQLVVWRRGEIHWTSGELKNESLESWPDHLGAYDYRFVSNENERYFSYSVKSRFTNLAKWVLDPLGEYTSWVFHGSPNFTPWIIEIPLPKCINLNDAVCLDGKPLKCRNDSVRFVLKKGYIDNDNVLEYDGDVSLGLSDCHAKCWNNCSCAAYTSSFANGTGCTFYTKELKFVPYDELDYLLVPHDESDNFYLLTLEHSIDSTDQKNITKVHSAKEPSLPPKIFKGDNGGKHKLWRVWCIVAIVPATVFLLFATLGYLSRKNRTEARITIQDKSLLALRSKITDSYKHNDTSKLKNDQKKGQELLLFNFLQIAAATNNFSSSRKLGEGGFGPVYEGILPDGQQIAVKRLARSSGQGVVEFKNEITLIAELQHINLVKLLGCCIEEEEKMLIYEYMPNKSLDSFLFDPIKRRQLIWKTWFNIIEGISQGLLYLHKYSRLRVIHRDLKASNILLDDQMIPKISDFGLARIFGQNEGEANTNRVVGTYGYMSPEYAMNGTFSVKSDIYSFGVLLLEIVSGMRNTALSHASGPLSLIEHAWNLWSRGASLELMDMYLGSSCAENQLLRCVHIGLLCVQACAMDRPSMSDVAAMLTNETISLPNPRQPGFYVGRNGNDVASCNVKSHHCSACCVSITELEAR